MKKVTILIPVYEEESLGLLYDRLTAALNDNPGYDFEMLFVNDGSTDNTLNMIKSLHKADERVSVLSLSRNLGKEIAMAAGIDHVDSDAMIIIDADLQDPPELMAEMLKYWEEGYQDIYAKRRSRQGETWLKKSTSHLFYRILQRLSDVEIQKDTGDFRLLDRKCIEALKLFDENQRYTKGLYSLIGFRKKEILFDRQSRAAGKTKWNYAKLMNLGIFGVTSFTTKPLRIAALTGFVCTFIAVLYAIFIIVKRIFWGDPVAGFPTLFGVVVFMGGLQMLGIGIMGEYIGIIFNETKKRPMYIVDEYTERSRREN